MNPVEIIVITEGATEREVGRVLWQRGILSNRGKPQPPNWKSEIGSREGYDQVIQALGRSNPLVWASRALLIFDQEDSPDPQQRVQKIQNDLIQSDGSGFWQGISFQPVSGFGNLFEHRDSTGRHFVLHISQGYSGTIPIGNQDFDGYILQLLQGPCKQAIVSGLLGGSPGVSPDALLQKAEIEITQLMSRNGYPWTHAKSWLYAYITVFQFRQSHMWFASRAVEVAPEQELRRVFASLIEAWDRLCR